jgi:acetate---CoA ligase (ADP-forming)
MRSRPPQQPEHRPADLPAGPARYLSEAESLTFLERHGLPTVPHRLCRSEEAARNAYRQLGGGVVVVKGCSPELPHKSEHGLVIVGVDSEEGVAAAFEKVQARMELLRLAPAAIVAPMVKDRRELVLGARVDPTFGPVLMLGDGGKYVETIGDVAVLLPPVTMDEVRQALFARRIAPILKGLRNEPPFDIEPFCAAAVRLGAIIMDGADVIASIDLNPVMVGRKGEGIVIVDALVERVMATAGS